VCITILSGDACYNLVVSSNSPLVITKNKNRACCYSFFLLYLVLLNMSIKVLHSVDCRWMNEYGVLVIPHVLL